MAGPAFPPLITRIEHQDNPEAERSFNAEVARILEGANRKLSDFATDARRNLDAALSVPRSAGGNLDIQLPQMRELANAQRQRAQAAREIYEAEKLLIQSSGKVTQEDRQRIAAAKELALAEEAAARTELSRVQAAEQLQGALNRQKSAVEGVAAAQRRGTTEQQSVINGVRAQRVAMVQLGQQMQDVVIQAQMGTSAFTIFAQQLPQAAFALSGLANTGGQFQQRIGRIATFLSGPWGAAIVGATALLGPFIARMLGLGDEADGAAKKTYDFSQRLDVLTLSARESANAMEQLANATRGAMAVQGDFLSSQAANAAKAVSDIEARLRSNRAALKASKAEAGSFTADPTEVVRRIRRRSELADAIEADKTALASARLAQQNAELALSQRAVVGEIDAATAATNRYAEAVGKLEARRRQSQTLEKTDPISAALDPNFMSDAAYRKELGRLTREKNAALDDLRKRNRSSSSTPTVTSAFISPVNGRITSGFGPRSRPMAGASSNHGGLDIAAAMGTAVRAPQVGVVEAVGYSPTLGKFVVINHGGGTKTRYGHLSDNSMVAAGMAVSQGQRIGSVGSTGRSTGPHLHYEVTVNGKKVDPSKGHFPIDDVKVAEAAQRAADALQEFGDRSTESIARVTSQFDEQPRLIDSAAAAVRDLDEVIAELSQRKPPDFQKMIEQAEQAKKVVADALVRPFRQLADDAARDVAMAALRLQGRDREAEVLTEIARMEETIGKLTSAQAGQVRAVIEARYDEAEAMERIADMQANYLDATRSVRSEVEAILAGQGKLSNFKQIFQRLRGQVLAEQLFGDVFRDLDKWVKEKTGVGSSVDRLRTEIDRSGVAVGTFADAVAAAAQRIDAGGGKSASSLLFGKSSTKAANDNLPAGVEELVVTGKRQGKTTLATMSPEAYMREVTSRLGERFASSLDATFGTTFFSRLGGVFSGAMFGYSVGGTAGGIIGAIKGIGGLSEKLDGTLGKALSGTATGSAVSGIAKGLGIKMSGTGAQIGGAIGSFLPIPGGDIIGAIAGGLIGKLFGKTKTGTATIGGVNGALGISGTGGSSRRFIESASCSANDIISSVQRIADAFGASIDASLGGVSIGIRNGKYRVDPTGRGNTKTGKGAIDFGKDGAAEAIRYATLDLIRDGVIQGLRQGTQTLLKSGDDIDAALQKALDFENVFNTLKELRDPVGAAIDAVDKEFTRLRKLAEEAGEGMVQVEELYAIKRAEAIKAAQEKLLGSLRGLYDELTIGDSGLSLRERRNAALAAYTPLADRVRSGDTAAFDDFASAAQTLLGIERELSGSQSAYFDLFNSIKDLTKSALDTQTALSDAAANRDSPFSSSTVPATDNASVVAAIETGNQAIVDAINANVTAALAANDNLGTLIDLFKAQPAGTAISFTGSY